jgi:hypothetical protein
MTPGDPDVAAAGRSTVPVVADAWCLGTPCPVRPVRHGSRPVHLTRPGERDIPDREVAGSVTGTIGAYGTGL